MRTLLQDVRFALRMLAKTPGVTAVILLTLALGIGANTAIFSFAYGVWLRPLPYPDSQRLTMVLAGDGTFGPIPLTSWSGLAELAEWQEQNSVFEEMAVFKLGRASLTGDGAPEQLSIAQVTPRFFETLGVSPALGRT
ncbi:MAG: hypothetical protein GEV06_22170, partial [Luteitalea sp.]|nr:hypothetical protein [Luteitalea sp.]